MRNPYFILLIDLDRLLLSASRAMSNTKRVSFTGNNC